jgi:ribosome maturation factor RimP
MSDLYNKLETILAPVLQKEEMELVDVEYKKEGANWFLRVYIEKDGGVGLNECSIISMFLNKNLDETDFFPNHYYLEVSSPGIERPLKKPQDFIRFRGSKIKVGTMVKIDGRKHWEGILVDFADGQVVLEAESETFRIPLAEITQAKLKVFD